jgi:CheY-like chemotaxis protein
MSAPDDQTDEARPRMLIAEDSSLGELLVATFETPFDVTLVKDEFEARQEIDETAQLLAEGKNCAFDVCIFDVIMPPDDAYQDSEEDTGLRLIQTALAKQVCRSAVVLTVRWDVAERLGELFNGSVFHKLLLKQKSETEQIETAVNEALASTRS